MSIEFVDTASLSDFRDSNPGALLIDVRDHEMHLQLRLAESISVPLEELQATDFSQGLAAALSHHADIPATTVLNSDHSILLVCQLGRRATLAAQFLDALIDNPLFVLSGGVSACQEAGLELCGGDS